MSNLKKSLDKQLTSYMSKSRKKFSSEKPSTVPGDRSSGNLVFNDSLDSLIGNNPNLAVDQTLEIHENNQSEIVESKYEEIYFEREEYFNKFNLQEVQVLI